jgi:syntaxin-binding protein 1
MVQSEMDQICRNDPEFRPPSPYKRAILLIVDRSIDALAPLLHDFTYQAMATDLVGLQNGRFMYLGLTK